MGLKINVDNETTMKELSKTTAKVVFDLFGVGFQVDPEVWRLDQERYKPDSDNIGLTFYRDDEKVITKVIDVSNSEDIITPTIINVDDKNDLPCTSLIVPLDTDKSIEDAIAFLTEYQIAYFKNLKGYASRIKLDNQ